MSELMPYSTVTAMASAYKAELETMRRCYNEVKASSDRLRTAFLDKEMYSSTFCISMQPASERSNHYGCEFESIERAFKIDAWRVIIDRIGIRKIMSIAKAKELNDQLDKGKDLPEISEETIIGVLQSWAGQAEEMVQQSVKEVFEFLRPWRSKYKTNNRWIVGKKVILTWYISGGYGSGGFRVNYMREKELMALDAVFHALDGKGTPAGTKSPLCDQINSAPEWNGQTEYFKWRACKNGNLHLEFKRLDLVKRLNYIAANRNEIGNDS